MASLQPYFTVKYPIFSVTFCLQRQKVTKERRRRCILAKNHFTTLNSREWRSPQTRAAKPRVLNASFKDFLNARLQSRHAIVTWRIFFLVRLDLQSRRLCSTNQKHLSARQSDWAERREKINGENVKKALVPWYATGCLTITWHFNAFSERHWFLAERVRRWLFFGFRFFFHKKKWNRFFCRCRQKVTEKDDIRCGRITNPTEQGCKSDRTRNPTELGK